MTDVTIMLSDNGPYIVRGGAKLVDAEGKEFEVAPKVPELSQRLEVRWYRYWGLERPGRNVERREDRGRERRRDGR